MLRIRFLPAVLLLVIVPILSACEDSLERADAKYERALTLVEEDDVPRAIIELKGVFDLNGQHQEARLLYASLVRGLGRYQEAYSQYLLSAEQYPNDVRPRIALSEIAIESGNWDDSLRHIRAAEELEPDNPSVQALVLARDFREQQREASGAELQELTSRARALLQTNPDLTLARSVLVDTLYLSGDPYGAIAAVDQGLERDPTNESMAMFKLRLLDEIGDQEGVGLHLQTLVDNFPENGDFPIMLVRWYLSRDDQASADAFLRDRIAKAAEDVDPKVTYIQFLFQVEGPEAALSAIDRFIEDGVRPDLFRTLRASTIYDMGDTEQAIAEMQQLIAEREPNDETRDMQVTLANMLVGVGRRSDAYDVADTVLSEDRQHVGALKLKADSLIEADQVGDAIIALRTALDQSPRDATLFTLLAKAHERDGNRELMADNLSQAVSASQFGLGESLRYARYLISDEKYASARDVLVAALRRQPGNIDLLRTLSEVLIAMSDWPGAEQVVVALRNSDTEQAQVLANGLEATILQRMQRTEESLTLLRGMLNEESTALVARTAIIRTHLANGEMKAARDFMDEALADDPDDPGTRFLNAALLSVEGDFEAANEEYLRLLEETPGSETIWRAYIASLARAGNTDAAIAATDDAIAAVPESMNLLWIKAGYEERAGNIDAAIGIYEDLYARQSGSTIIANNLASLLSTHRASEEDLQRAHVIARRLNGTEIPAFQDTYGWIAHRLGNHDEALDYLRSAAAGLPQDARVQEHYGHVLEALRQLEDAKAQFEKAQALLPPESERQAVLQERVDAIEAALSGN